MSAHVDVSDVLVVTDLPGSARRWVLHPPEDAYGDGDIHHLDVELHDDGLFARGSSVAEGLADFLDRLVVRWRGWEGTLTWESMEHDCVLDATHDGSRVTLGVALRRPFRAYAADAWSARVVFSLEPGEQLRDLSRAVSQFLSRE